MTKLSSVHFLDLDEILNTLTHGFGMLLSAAGLALLVVFASDNGNAWHVVSCSIYGATLLILYTASTLYHSARESRIKQILAKCDHVAIYLLIAGSYTPFTLVNMRQNYGWVLFVTIWGMAILGSLYTIYVVRKNNVISTLVYILMGWTIILAIHPLQETVMTGGITLLILGGVTYTAGTIFFLLDHRIRFGHAVWHLFVLGGSIFHYFAVMFYVIP